MPKVSRGEGVFSERGIQEAKGMINTAIRILCVLVGVATTARALPLRPGGSWVYAVVNRGKASIALKSLRVLDSTAVSGGTNWRLVLRDSVSGATDSLAIMAWDDGSQTWARSSPNLPWGPTRWDRSPRVWWDGWWDVSLARGTWEQPVMVNRNQVFSRPPLAWDEAAGLVWTQDPMTGAEWTMLAHDGVELTRPWRLELPEVGARWTWKHSAWSVSLPQAMADCEAASALDSAAAQARFGGLVSSTSTISWEVVERPTDSAGWARLTIRQTSSGADSLFFLRLHPETRWRKADAGLQGFDESWWQLPGETVVGGFAAHDEYSVSRGLGGLTMGLVSWCQRGSSRTSASRILDSSMSTTTSSTSTTHGSSSTWSMTEIVLLQDGERLVRSSPLAVGDFTKGPRGLRALEALADRYPATQVRWRDLRGRGGSFPASSLEAVLDRPAMGLLFLEARFPDGTRWSGRVF